ncbi:MFS transporter, DHA1 family, purine ribonucleoside efflux pump [Rhodoferax sp. OV413]|uniref:MFS transporter n=1 Tax=Rhodoferax sp. OV413 TaxID=1855285 RepID=UPI0008874B29|nr:MFS transporter [Rhodoferax sp. OV413]SDO28642.1 MFS transporter, DHA1 family, purine ribonucleoside efflux pump [Rhodoferax sp. OV413]
MNIVDLPLGRTTLASTRPAWGAVLSLALCVCVLIASEFMPVSLLTPIAHDLGMSEGRAGQAISISGIFAVLTSLLNAPLTGSFDRRRVLLGFTALLTLSGVVVASATNYTVFMLGRALLGVAIGGFWSMSTATIMRLVPAHAVPKALAILNGGNALAATIAAPLGSFLGQYLGWRGAFFMVVPLAVAAFAWQWARMPTMPGAQRNTSGNPFVLLRRPEVALGLAAVMLLFMGQFAVFTYLRPFLETITGVAVSTLSLMLLLMGSSGLVGTYIVGQLLKARLFTYLVLIPLCMAVLALLLIALGASASAVALLLLGWGLIGTAAPVAWGVWLSKTLPHDAETGGGLMVAAIQLAITLGAGLGGALFDAMGWWSTFALGAMLLAGSAVLAWAAWWVAR